jgi:hypothetical protein
MAREETRDANGNLLFYVEDSPSGRLVRTAGGNLLGSVGMGQTRDASGNLILNAEQPAVLYPGPLQAD